MLFLYTDYKKSSLRTLTAHYLCTYFIVLLDHNLFEAVECPAQKDAEK
jgi:hypothetical protein